MSTLPLPLCQEIALFLHFLKRQILDSSKQEEFAEDNFEFEENGRIIPKRRENAVG